MGKFGWSYPAGCSGTPYDDCPEPSELSEKVLEVLEEAGVDTKTNDQIMKLIEDWERGSAEPHVVPEYDVFIRAKCNGKDCWEWCDDAVNLSLAEDLAKQARDILGEGYDVEVRKIQKH